MWGRPLAEALYGSAEAGSYLVILGPAMPLMYLESMVDGAMKGVGEQKAVFRYSMWDSCLRIVGVLLLLPRFGMKGFLFVILLSSFYTCTANTGRLLSSCGLRLQLWRWLGAPGFAGAVSAGAGLTLRHLLADWLTGGVLLQLAAIALGGAGWQWSALRRRGRWASAKSCGPWRQGKGGIRKMSKSEIAGHGEENRV